MYISPFTKLTKEAMEEAIKTNKKMSSNTIIIKDMNRPCNKCKRWKTYTLILIITLAVSQTYMIYQFITLL